jgi:invasion protein IalB
MEKISADMAGLFDAVGPAICGGDASTGGPAVVRGGRVMPTGGDTGAAAGNRGAGALMMRATGHRVAVFGGHFRPQAEAAEGHRAARGAAAQQSGTRFMVYSGIRTFLRGAVPAAVCAWMLAPAGAIAQEAGDAAPQSAWVKVCQTNPTSGKESCNVSQQLIERQRFIASFSVQPLPDKAGQFGVAAFVPLNVFIPEGIAFLVDKKKEGAIPYVFCKPADQETPEGCAANGVLGEEFLAALRRGNELGLGIVNTKGQQLVIKMTLVGFSKVYDGEGLDPVAARAQEVERSKRFQDEAQAAYQRMIQRQQQQEKTTN